MLSEFCDICKARAILDLYHSIISHEAHTNTPGSCQPFAQAIGPVGLLHGEIDKAIHDDSLSIPKQCYLSRWTSTFPGEWWNIIIFPSIRRLVPRSSKKCAFSVLS